MSPEELRTKRDSILETRSSGTLHGDDERLFWQRSGATARRRRSTATSACYRAIRALSQYHPVN